MGCMRLDQRRARPPECAPATPLRIRAQRGVPAAQRVERLAPRGLVSVRLASRHGLHMPRLDERGREPLRLQPREDRQPRDPGRCPGDGVQVAGDPPVHQGVQSGAKGRNDAHGLGVCAVQAVMLGGESPPSRCSWSRRTREAPGRHREVGSEGSVERPCGARDTNRIGGVGQPGRAGTPPHSPPSTIGLCCIHPASMHGRYDR